ncbi:MAG: YdcF family protein [Novosphingobium sp.]
MLRRLLFLILLGYLLGFAWFALELPGAAGNVTTDAVVVLTGGEGRITRGLNVLRAGQAKQLLISGVDKDVKPRELAAEFKVAKPLMRCCITLGYDAVDTASNASESARWIAERKFTSVRLVTSDWHMRRAAWDLSLLLPSGVKVVEDAVPTHPSARILVLEYNKLLARLALGLWRI